MANPPSSFSALLHLHLLLLISTSATQGNGDGDYTTISEGVTMSNRILPRRREAFDGFGRMARGFPVWVTTRDRRLLQVVVNGTRPDVVVAKDGSGNFTTLGEAVEAAPNNSPIRFVIYLRRGIYFENVLVKENKVNLMIIGDGIDQTLVKANQNIKDNGGRTFATATVGPEKEQAVAFLSQSDRSTFYHCSFLGYQVTLYVHSNRQFYRECDIYGMVDFIFGDAAVVFQSCNIYARLPSPNQKNVITAQGRTKHDQNSGIAIQNCRVTAAPDLIPVLPTVKTYLGRPWKEFSRTVFLQSYLDSLIDPAGWLEWDDDFALSTLEYDEYQNTGPGSSTANQVRWPGYRVISSSSDANNFTVASLIDGDQWLGSTLIPFIPGLMS